MPEVEALTGPDRPAVTTIEVDRRARTGAWPVVRGVCRRAFDRRYSGLWVLVALIAIFSALKPQYFPTRVTVMTILSNQAVIGILAIAAMIPLLTGLVDLSIAGVAGFAVVFAAWLSTRVSVNPIVLCLVVLVVTSGFGLLSGGLVTRLGINSIVTTLGVSTVALGLAESFAGGNTITPRFSPRLFKFGQSHLSVIPLSFIYFAVLAVIAYVVLEQMPLGRRLQATGSNAVASRLAGVRVHRLRFLALLSAAVISGFAGLVLVAQVGTASDVTGPGLLLPVLSTVFLGATQIKPRPNVAGTVVALLVLGTGIKGIELLGAKPWINDFFYGCMLLVAVALAASDVGRLE